MVKVDPRFFPCKPAITVRTRILPAPDGRAKIAERTGRLLDCDPALRQYPLMKATLLFVTCAGIASSAVLSFAADAEPPATDLFNGRDLAGWTVMHDASFAVTNSNLRLVTGMGWLRTDKQYSDFVLELEWRAMGSNYDSGIFLRAGLEGKPWPENGWQVNLARGALGALVRGYKTMVPAETPPAPVNQWVKFRIEARGPRITLDVDGERAWEYDKADSLKGFIGIQAENKAFEFRNIRLTEISQRPLPAQKLRIIN